MPADSGTQQQQQQQQQHEYTNDTCCVLTADRYMCLMRVSCVLYYRAIVLILFSRLVTRLVASHDMCKTKSGCRFRMGILSENSPPFSCWRPTRKRFHVSENGTLKS